MDENEPVIEEERGTDKKSLRQLYNSVAEEHPLVQEIMEGLTSFSEALEEIVSDLRSGEFSAIDDFNDYLATLVDLTNSSVLLEKENKGLVKFHGKYSDRKRKSRRKAHIFLGALFAGIGGTGEYLIRQHPEYAQLGLYLRSGGISGFASTAANRVSYLFGGWRFGRKFNKAVTILREEADTLDEEVIKAFFDYIDIVQIDDDEIKIKWADTEEEFEQYKTLVEAKGNMDMSTLDELHPDSGEYLLVLAVAGDKVIGGVGLVDRNPRIYLDSFIVDEEWRNRGVGSAMVDEIHEHCVFPGHTLAAIVASGVNKKKFEGMGFELLYKKDALKEGLEYKDDDYATRPKNKGCSLFLRPKRVDCEL